MTKEKISQQRLFIFLFIFYSFPSLIHVVFFLLLQKCNHFKLVVRDYIKTFEGNLEMKQSNPAPAGAWLI